jgi:hypothetical protein
VAGGPATGTPSVSTAPGSGEISTAAPTLEPRVKNQVDKARQAQLKSVVLTISTVQGATERTAEALRALGGTVESTDATVGYIRVSVPLDLVAHAATLEGISRVDVEEPIGFPDPTP